MSALPNSQYRPLSIDLLYSVTNNARNSPHHSEFYPNERYPSRGAFDRVLKLPYTTTLVQKKSTHDANMT